MSLSDTPTDLELCVMELENIGAVKFGDFVLKSGIKSPIYFDLRVIVSYPKIMEMVSNLMWKEVEGETFDHLCGVPYTALPIATILSLKKQIPMLIRRKEAKSHGTKKMIEGIYSHNQKCLILEDVIVSGSSVVETVEILRNEKLEAKRTVVFLDREQGGKENLSKADINVSSVITIREMLEILQKFKKVDEVSLKNVMNYLESHKNVPVPSQRILPVHAARKTIEQKITEAKNPLARRILKLVSIKKSNLCVAVDVETSEELLNMAEKLGPYICLLKTHVDILKDFSLQTVEALKGLASKHHFLIFEDRKFADIGNTVKLQYSGGLHHIASWAHLVTIHGIPGPGIIEALKSSGCSEDRGCVIVAEMSSDQNLITEDYVRGCVKLGKEHSEIVVGFVCQNPKVIGDDFITFTPGISLSSSGDALGQRYVTPEVAITERGTDIVIVGRGITKDPNPSEKAKLYQERCYKAFLDRNYTDA